jgi:hypothetical protein
VSKRTAKLAKTVHDTTLGRKIAVQSASGGAERSFARLLVTAWTRVLVAQPLSRLSRDITFHDPIPLVSFVSKERELSGEIVQRPDFG